MDQYTRVLASDEEAVFAGLDSKFGPDDGIEAEQGEEQLGDAWLAMTGTNLDMLVVEMENACGPVPSNSSKQQLCILEYSMLSLLINAVAIVILTNVPHFTVPESCLGK